MLTPEALKRIQNGDLPYGLNLKGTCEIFTNAAARQLSIPDQSARIDYIVASGPASAYIRTGPWNQFVWITFTHAQTMADRIVISASVYKEAECAHKPIDEGEELGQALIVWTADHQPTQEAITEYLNTN